MHTDNFVFGTKVIQQLIEYHNTVIHEIYLKKDHRLLSLIQAKKIPYHFWNKEQFYRMAGNHNHQYIVAFIKPYEYYPFVKLCDDLKQNSTTKDLILILDHLQDNYNLGSILRTAQAAGVTSVIIPNFNQVFINAATIKAAMGFLFNLKIVKVPNLANAIVQLKKIDFWVFASVVQGPFVSLRDNCQNIRIALIIGNESQGISSLLLKNTDFKIKLPMVNTESLNTSNAAAILMYQIREWQNFWTLPH